MSERSPSVHRQLVARQRRGQTAFTERGQGELIVFIHGVGLNADAWQPQVDAFAGNHRVICIDMLGHGESDAPPEAATLDSYVNQLRQLLDDLAIPSANIIGHSMGGLVAIGFALAHPSRTLRLAVLNSVYERDELRRRAVEARAGEIVASRRMGDVEEPLRRWFGGDTKVGVAAQVREWLTAMDPVSYGTAYQIFATSDRAFSGQLGQIKAPALYATGSLDPNSTPAMAEAMAAATPGAQARVLEGERHMMNLVSPEATNALIRELLARAPSALDPRELRKAFGAFMTGVTVVTTAGIDGQPRGFTANSFTSVSLDPPLLLVCIAKNAASLDTFRAAKGFAVNILAEEQKDVSGTFASKRADKFETVSWHSGPSGNPLIDGSAAWFDCRQDSIVDAGDHVILLGRIDGFSHTDRNPLGYLRGGYVTLGLEQAAVNAASSGGRTVIGAILEHGNRLLLREEVGGGYSLPEITSGTVSTLTQSLAAHGLTADLSFLFAVFENPQTREQSIYYRGEAHGQPGPDYKLFGFDDLPLNGLKDEAIRIMLRRYADERRAGRFKIYSGDHERGEVKPVDWSN